MIHFVSALHCEARPIIERYRLKPAGNHGRIALYNSSAASLAVSGVGITQSAIAATVLKGSTNATESDVWINLGICGHRDLPIGETILANRVSSRMHRESFYPRILSKVPFTQTGIETVLEPTSDYPPADAVEMEAYGFFQACLHFTTLERIQAIKIVSDNASANADRKFDKDWIAQLVAERMDSIAAFAESLLEKTQAPQPKTSTSAIETALLAKHHYSVTERHQLKSRLDKVAHLLDGDTLPSPEEVANKTKAQAAEAIDALIDHAAVITRK